MKVLFIEPYYGGSHKLFADGYKEHSMHEIEIMSMPPRKWKWRMRGAAIWLAEELPESLPDIILASDFLDLATFVSLLSPDWQEIPRVAYFHENQLTYPVNQGECRDYQFGFTNITTCLAADAVFFNSHYHKDDFLCAAGKLLKRMPDYIPKKVPQLIGRKSEIVPVGLDLAGFDAVKTGKKPAAPGEPLHIIWNHRWEFDKNPEEFSMAMQKLNASGLPFTVSILGCCFGRVPLPFKKIKMQLGDRVRHMGFIEDRTKYIEALSDGDLVLSTSQHEFFGLSVMEAVYAGCFPLLPCRLSYPELLPECRHSQCLYTSFEELVSRLKRFAGNPELVRKKDLTSISARFSWERVSQDLDSRLLALSDVTCRRGSPG